MTPLGTVVRGHRKVLIISNDLLRLAKRYTNAQAGKSPFSTPIDGLTILCSDSKKQCVRRRFSWPACVLRIVRLLETPEAIPILAPLIMREMSYWLLTGPHCAQVARVVLANDHVKNVVKAIHALRQNFVETIRVDDLAAIAQMSPSAFHRRFRALTSMSPLQYQKHLPLLEARHLLPTGAVIAETAAFQVGYAEGYCVIVCWSSRASSTACSNAARSSTSSSAASGDAVQIAAAVPMNSPSDCSNARYT